MWGWPYGFQQGHLSRGLCGVFHDLAAGTWAFLLAFDDKGLRPGEETITDLIVGALAHLPEDHVPAVRIKVHSKPDEGRHGGDWDLFVIDNGQSVGIRFQAKVAQPGPGRFEHLHYASGKAKKSQATKLLASSASDGMVPMYLLYQAWRPPEAYTSPHVGMVGFEAHGCSLLDPRWVGDNVPLGTGASLHEVTPHEVPWELLFCRASGSASVAAGILATLQQVGLADPELEVGPTPDHVHGILAERVTEDVLRSTVVVDFTDR